MKESRLTVPSPCSALMLTVDCSSGERTIRGYLREKNTPFKMLAYGIGQPDLVRLSFSFGHWVLWLDSTGFDLRTEDVDRIAAHLHIAKPEIDNEVAGWLNVDSARSQR